MTTPPHRPRRTRAAVTEPPVQPEVAGQLSDNDMYESNRDLRRFLLGFARLTPAFVDRVIATPPDEIWVPTPQELLAGRVINRVNR